MKTLLASILVVAVPLVASAQDAKKAPAAGAPAAPPAAKTPPPAAQPLPTPAKELDTAKALLKTWSCTGTNMAGEKTTSKLTFKLDLEKFWINVRYDLAKTKTSPGFTGQAFLGVDAVSKGWVFEGMDSMGGMIHLKAAAAAVTADKMVFEGEGTDPRGKMPAKFTLSLDAKTKHLNFVGEFGGKPAFNEDCK